MTQNEITPITTSELSRLPERAWNRLANAQTQHYYKITYAVLQHPPPQLAVSGHETVVGGFAMLWADGRDCSVDNIN